MSHSIPALLPMKGHSERVPNKNLRPLAGRPLFTYVLETLLKSKLISGVVIDTDSAEISREAARYPRTTLIDRPEHLRGDLVPMTEILKHDIQCVAGEVFLQTHATNPLLTLQTLDRAISTFFSHPDRDSLVSVTSHQSRFFRTDGSAINHDPNQLLRTQDLEPIYEENSSLYIFSRRCLTETGRRFSSRATFFPMNKLEAIDIDTEEDFRMVEALISFQKGIQEIP